MDDLDIKTNLEYKIAELDDLQIDRWNEFVMSQTDTTFFHRAEWKNVIETSFGHKTYFLYAEYDGEICGIYPLGHVKSKLFGNALISSPFCVHGGISATSTAAFDALDEAGKVLATKLNVDYLDYRGVVPVHSSWKKKELYVNFSKKIDPDNEQNLKNIPRKQRAMVRKAIKNDLTGTIDLSIDRFYQAYAESVHALGTPVFAKKYFQILKDTFKDDCEILTICKDEQLVCSVMSFYFKDTVLPYYGGGTPLARRLKGNDFMYWELMSRACDRKIKIFDYGRSKEGTGSYSFKKNWGFEPTPLHYEYFLVNATDIPDINPLNPKYKLFISLWKKMPLFMTKIIGPLIVKNLG